MDSIDSIILELVNAQGIKINAETIYEGPANLFFGIESVGGKLFLTKDALLFYSHGINLSSRKKFTVIKLDEVIEAKISFLTFFNLTTKTRKYKFVGGLSGKKKWVNLINKQVALINK
tara:strand:+ start:193 stop:546 length:354 start_codon:yes stop_codon:yes gene_type:complete